MDLPRHCQKYAKIKDIPAAIQNINAFCVLLQANKVKDSKAAFLKLPFVVQCLFLHHGWEILSHKSKYSAESYVYAFLLFKLFRGKEMKGTAIYTRYTKLRSLEGFYKKALKFKSKSPSLIKKTPSTRRASKKYDKEYQRYEAPKSELDAALIFYTSLYSQKPKSRLATTWLTEHGVFDGAVRKNLIRRDVKLQAAGKLIK